MVRRDSTRGPAAACRRPSRPDTTAPRHPSRRPPVSTRASSPPLALCYTTVRRGAFTANPSFRSPTSSHPALVRALVIKSWRSSTKPIDQHGHFVSIVGRKGGLLAWLLSLLGVDPTTQIRVSRDRVEFKQSSLAGTESKLIPLEGICSSYYGYYKPWKEALTLLLVGVGFGSTVIGPLFGMSQIGALCLGALLGTVVSVIYYVLNRTLTLGFVEQSGLINGIRFKKSVIENLEINEPQARQVCLLVQHLIETKPSRRAPTPAPADASPTGAPVSAVPGA